MNILHLTSGGDVGGAKTHVLSLLRELGKEHKVKLVCFVEGPFAQEARELGIPTHVIRNKNPFALRKALLASIKSGNYEIVHCHGAKANLFSAWIRRKLSVPVISTIHSDPRLDYLGRPLANMTYGVLNRISMRRRDGWVAVSDSMKELLISRGYPGDSIWPIYNGIEFPEKLKYRPRNEYLKHLGLDWDDDAVIYGIAARITSVKDLPTLIRAFRQTVEEIPNARLLIAGDGEQRPSVEALAKELCPEGTVHFAGWLDDMTSFYHCLDVNMLSSISEAFPYAIPEGGRMYCPTIATAVGGVPKILVDGYNGYLVEPKDDKTMAQRMIRLASDRSLRLEMGRNMYDKVRKEFSAETTASRQMEIYEALFARRRREAQGRYGAVICGAYGRGNAGDDSILLTMIRQLRQEDPYLPICVLSRRPKDTAILTGVSALPIVNLPGIRKVMKRSTLYISGGGSLIQNVTSNRSLLYYLYSITQAKRCGCDVMMYGCGIGPVSGKLFQNMARKVLEKNVDLITLRDPESANTLAGYGVTRPVIKVTADMAMEMTSDLKGADRFLENCGLDPAQKYCMFALRPWENTLQSLEHICAAAEYAYRQYGMMPLFFSFEPGRDREINEKAAAMVKVPCMVLPQIGDGAVLCGVIARMELVVSMRLHALIFACGQKTRTVAISYDPKVSGFMNYMGSDNCLELSGVTESALHEKIDRAMTEGVSAERLNHLKALAAENGRMAGKLLRGEKVE
ncbi:MAG: polysaccharide pyruvyl transferase CsaB [Oscillospiraceae bacterium]|nr:polysaccharide pyruvyl transferase CsaB [Oscillospiraceae bacterium]